MANPLLEDIVTYLTNLGIVRGDGIDTFRDFKPDKPDNLIALIEYKGSAAVFYEPTVHRSIQISVRNKSADAARRKALEIYTALQSDNLRVDFTEDRWGQVSLRQTPFRTDTDTSGRVTYVFNAGITTTIE